MDKFGGVYIVEPPPPPALHKRRDGDSKRGTGGGEMMGGVEFKMGEIHDFLNKFFFKENSNSQGMLN